jgi:hypothetical protein
VRLRLAAVADFEDDPGKAVGAGFDATFTEHTIRPNREADTSAETRIGEGRSGSRLTS